MTSPPPRPRQRFEIGDTVPIEKPKLDVRPARFVDDPATGPKGVFRNGRS